MMAPIDEVLAGETDGVVYSKVDADENPDQAMGLRIASIPTRILFANGEAVDHIVGVTPKEGLNAMFDRDR